MDRRAGASASSSLTACSTYCTVARLPPRPRPRARRVATGCAELGRFGTAPEQGRRSSLNGLADRLALVAALECVDAVTWFDEDTPEALIAVCRPQVLAKGGDWPPDRIVGAGGVPARGGQVVSIPFEHERSTTALLTRIRKA